MSYTESESPFSYKLCAITKLKILRKQFFLGTLSYSTHNSGLKVTMYEYTGLQGVNYVQNIFLIYKP